MAACDLKVLIDDPKKDRAGGEQVSGTVVVKTNKDVNCKALEVTCYWATHGRGNVARGDVEATTLFQGNWQAGQEYRYTFKLNSAKWPPTYYGNYLNVSHYIGARAKVPWSTDPKTETEFTISSAVTPPDLSPTVVQKKSFNLIGWIVAGIFIAIFLVLLLFIAMFLVPIVLIGAAIFWFFKIYLPKQLTGPIELVVEPKSLKPGESLKGTCQFTPRRNLSINGISWTIKCIEKCVSGSGSNRSTHSHDMLTKKQHLAEEGTLPIGQLRKFDFAFAIPSSAPPSLKFTDNELTWSSEFRIDIPKWPDWTKTIPFVVEASPHKLSSSFTPTDSPITSSETDDDPWLTEVLTQVHQSQHDPERLEAVLGAVRAHVFSINLNIQGEIDEPFDYLGDPDVEQEEAESDDDDSDVEEYWTAAIDPKRNARISLLWPENPEELLWTDLWRGSASVIGIDSDTERVMMRVVSDATSK